MLTIDREISPSTLTGGIKAIASKSDAHRILICAALSQEETQIYIGDINDDIRATINLLCDLGTEIVEVSKGKFNVKPNGFTDNSTIDACESGSTLRFILPVVGAICSNTTIKGQGRLPQRPLSPLREQLEEHCCEIKGETLPIIVGGGLTCGEFVLAGDVSSQYITGLLFALPLLKGDSKIILTTKLESADYVEMTLRTLSLFKIEIKRLENGFFIKGNQSYISPKTATADGDWSNAAFWLCAGAIGEKIAVNGLNFTSTQGDKKIIEILREFGAKITIDEDTATVYNSSLKAITIDAAPVPDLVPILAVVASVAEGTTKIINAKRLRIKESDRLFAVAECLNKLGGDVQELPDGLIIRGVKTLSGGTVDSFNDHRIAMAMSVAATVSKNPITIKNSGAVAKSYPEFFTHFKELGGVLNVL